MRKVCGMFLLTQRIRRTHNRDGPSLSFIATERKENKRKNVMTMIVTERMRVTRHLPPEYRHLVVITVNRVNALPSAQQGLCNFYQCSWVLTVYINSRYENTVTHAIPTCLSHNAKPTLPHSPHYNECLGVLKLQ